MGSGRITELAVKALGAVRRKLRPSYDASIPDHLLTGQAGERAVHFHLRRLGWTVVAQNWRSPRRKGELDLVAWDGDVLAFVEVKTRSQKGLVPAEMSVDRAKRDELLAMAREFLRRMPPGTQHRFDVASVYLEGKEPEITLFKDAFWWRSMKSDKWRR